MLANGRLERFLVLPDLGFKVFFLEPPFVAKNRLFTK